MKPIYARQFPLNTPDEMDFQAIEMALAELLGPLSLQLDMKFTRRLRKRLWKIELPKRCILLEEGAAPQGVYFILSGSLLVGIGMNGNMQLNQILRKGDFVLPLKLFGGGKSKVEMRMAEDSHLLFMEAKKYQRMLNKFPQAVTLSHLWRDRQEEQVSERKREFRTLSTVQRLHWLYKKWPDCFLVFSDEVIGAYLDLGRETVCRKKGEVIRHG